jgi:hypothetical protein
MGVDRVGGRRRDGGAAGGAAVNPDTLSILALAVSALVVGVALLAYWLWRRGGPHKGDPLE